MTNVKSKNSLVSRETIFISAKTDMNVSGNLVWHSSLPFLVTERYQLESQRQRHRQVLHLQTGDPCLLWPLLTLSGTPVLASTDRLWYQPPKVRFSSLGTKPLVSAQAPGLYAGAESAPALQGFPIIRKVKKLQDTYILLPHPDAL